ncbi:MAG TPA: translation elongation factor-like protein [Candidatus Latescibacteria bacterium]|nr:translation elongation factor-like protein [Candidatus Latescibacterota bacterium]
MPELEIGKVTGYFTRIGVAAIELTGSLSIGDTIHIKGHTTDFTQEVGSMQIEHQLIEKAEAGQRVGIKVKERVRKGDIVYKVV